MPKTQIGIKDFEGIVIANKRAIDFNKQKSVKIEAVERTYENC